jgi:hypothetical protein
VLPEHRPSSSLLNKWPKLRENTACNSNNFIRTSARGGTEHRSSAPVERTPQERRSRVKKAAISA